VGYHVQVSLLVPLITWPVLGVSIGLVITSVILALFILLHKGKGGGMSDLFGGGMSTAMGGTSVAERNLDRITIVIGSLWFGCIIALLILYRFGI
jgi:preprotein translocase subunit SecG